MRQWPAACTGRWRQPASGGVRLSADAWPRLSLTAGASTEGHAHGSPPLPLGSRDGSSGSYASVPAGDRVSERATVRASVSVNLNERAGELASELASVRACDLASECVRARVRASVD